MMESRKLGSTLDSKVFKADEKITVEKIERLDSIIGQSVDSSDLNSLFDESATPLTLINIDLTDVEQKILNSEFDSEGKLCSSFVTEQLCYTMALMARDVFRREPALLEIGRPAFIVGDIHGQFSDLLRILESLGYPPAETILFLGDYVDRGQCSLEVVVTLLLMKIRYPDRVYILRGNHEVAKVNKRYGFKNECMNRFKHLNVYNIFNRVFDHLPIAALVDLQFFCCHGGISEILLRQQPGVENLKRVINSIQRPFSSLHHRELETDLLWSDPMEDGDPKKNQQAKPIFSTSSRGIGYKFNAEATDAFVQLNSLKAIIRAHQVMNMGLSVQHNMQCITVFSAPGYYNNKNFGAVAYLMRNDDSELVNSIRVLQFSPRASSRGGGGNAG